MLSAGLPDVDSSCGDLHGRLVEPAGAECVDVGPALGAAVARPHLARDARRRRADCRPRSPPAEARAPARRSGPPGRRRGEALGPAIRTCAASTTATAPGADRPCTRSAGRAAIARLRHHDRASASVGVASHAQSLWPPPRAHPASAEGAARAADRVPTGAAQDPRVRTARPWSRAPPRSGRPCPLGDRGLARRAPAGGVVSTLSCSASTSAGSAGGWFASSLRKRVVPQSRSWPAASASISAANPFLMPLSHSRRRRRPVDDHPLAAMEGLVGVLGQAAEGRDGVPVRLPVDPAAGWRGRTGAGCSPRGSS